MIESGELEPTIVVTPSYYQNNHSGQDGALTENFHHELVGDLIPAVESKYHTYAETTDAEGLQKSREHRAFGGFSMGSVTTWYTFINCLDTFKYFLPMSGDSWVMGQMGGSDTDYSKTAAYLNEVAQNSGYQTDDYAIFAATGTDDIAYDSLSAQIEAMKAYPESFVYSPDFATGNFHYSVQEGAAHSYTYMVGYVYNILPYFFK